MGFLKSLKGKFQDSSDFKSKSKDKDKKEGIEDDFRSPYQPPDYESNSSTDPNTRSQYDDDAYENSTRKNANLYNSHRNNNDYDEGFAPPPGPPPSHFQSQLSSKDREQDPFADSNRIPSPGPPMAGNNHSKGDRNENEYYVPPSGPPPSHQQKSSLNNDFSNASASASANPPPYQDWYTVPDNSLLPPPPSMQEDYSPANNASVSSKDAGFDWCDRMGVYVPAAPSRDISDAVHRRGNIGLTVPREFRGRVRDLSGQSQGGGGATKRYLISTSKGQDDVTILSSLPLYFAVSENPLRTGGTRSVKIGFEIQIKRLLDEDSSVAVSFSNAPYPPFRLPGWHRGSLAIHSDDGRKYVNDSWGGTPFTHSFEVDDTLTLKADVYAEMSPVQRSRNRHAVEVSGLPKCRTRIELERYGPGGEWVGGWDVSEERDERMEGVDGLQGEGDLYAAIGICGGVEVEIRFWPQG